MIIFISQALLANRALRYKGRIVEQRKLFYDLMKHLHSREFYHVVCSVMRVNMWSVELLPTLKKLMNLSNILMFKNNSYE